MHKLTKDLVSEDDQRKLGIMSQKFMDYSPDFKGAITPEESVKAVLSVVESSSVANDVDAEELIETSLHFGRVFASFVLLEILEL